MTTRRSFLAGLAAAGLAPAVSWADAGSPDYLSAARLPDGKYILAGLTISGEIVFQLPLPGRGHAAAAHPDRAEVVAFARRPGRFASVLDCVTGQVLSAFEAPEGRHFYGHGTYSTDGNFLYTTENDYEAGSGIIGVWDATRNYRRVGEFSSGGTGPHELALMPDGDTLVVANGGIETHPDSGRTKLNLATMKPNLSYLGSGGELKDQVFLGSRMRLNSIRHLSVRPDGLVAFALQWQGELPDAPPLLGFHKLGHQPELAEFSEPDLTGLRGYVGSVAFSAKGGLVAITSPRGSHVQVYDAGSRKMVSRFASVDVCGVRQGPGGFFATNGAGDLSTLNRNRLSVIANHGLSWDNHLVYLGHVA